MANVVAPPTPSVLLRPWNLGASTVPEPRAIIVANFRETGESVARHTPHEDEYRRRQYERCHSNAEHAGMTSRDVAGRDDGDPRDGAPLINSDVVSPRWSMRQRRIVVTALAVTAALVAVGVWQSGPTSRSANDAPLVGRTGKLAPVFRLTSLTNPSKTISLLQFRGKPLVINFWASWCGPCRAEMPLLEATYRSENGRVQFLGIDSNDTRSAGLAFYHQVGVTYPSISDPTLKAAIEYGVYGFPTTVFISASGRVVGRYIDQLHAGVLHAALREAFHF